MDKTAKQLKQMGYRVVSRKDRLISRIDRCDWGNFHKDEDFYRRCISNDVLIVPASYLSKIPNSQHSNTGYIKNPLDISG